MKSLSWKIFFGFLFVVLSMTVLLFYFTYHNLINNAYNHVLSELKQQNSIILASVYTKGDLDFDKLKQISRDNINNITLINMSGLAIFDSNTNSDLIPNQSNSIDYIKLISGKSDTWHYFDDEKIVFSKLIKTQKGNFILRISSDASFKDEIFSTLQKNFILVSFLAIVISFVLSIILSNRIIKPIRILSRASRKVALGDFDNKLYLPGNDEVAQLARNFNQMTIKLNDYFKLAEARQEEYLTLIESIEAALFVIDDSGKINLYNKSFEDIARAGIIEGRFYWELVNSNDLKDLYKSIIKEKRHITGEFELNNKYYLCSGNYIESKNEVVILLNDITPSKQLENVKRDFVVNVTHELRTPLTAIKGFVETIEDEPGEEISTYIEIIKRHTERLINIVEDLLTLSEIEQHNSRIEPKPTHINKLFDNIYKIFEPRIKKKNLEFEIKVDETLPLIDIDSFRIEQVIINLIDNAIKYTDSGIIKLHSYLDNDYCQILISDTGIGIPKEHHSRLFERFYTVDKSRSRKVGGTGLGLSIVKHIIQLHKGTISIDSSAGKGTQFIIKLPIKQHLLSYDN